MSTLFNKKMQFSNFFAFAKDIESIEWFFLKNKKLFPNKRQRKTQIYPNSIQTKLVISRHLLSFGGYIF